MFTNCAKTVLNFSKCAKSVPKYGQIRLNLSTFFLAVFWHQKNPKNLEFTGFSGLFGRSASGGIRTCDPFITSEVLCLLSYGGMPIQRQLGYHTRYFISRNKKHYFTTDPNELNQGLFYKSCWQAIKQPPAPARNTCPSKPRRVRGAAALAGRRDLYSRWRQGAAWRVHFIIIDFEYCLI